MWRSLAVRRSRLFALLESVPALQMRGLVLQRPGLESDDAEQRNNGERPRRRVPQSPVRRGRLTAARLDELEARSAKLMRRYKLS